MEAVLDSVETFNNCLFATLKIDYDLSKIVILNKLRWLLNK